MSDTSGKTAKPEFKTPLEQAPEIFDEFVKTGEGISVSVRKAAEQGVTQARKAYDGLKEAAEAATDMLEDTFSSASSGFLQLNLKALDNAKALSDANFALARALLGAKSPAEAFEVQTTFARDRLQTLTQQAKSYAELVGDITASTAQPAKNTIVKTIKTVSAAA